jgi:hypothetical protein
VKRKLVEAIMTRAVALTLVVLALAACGTTRTERAASGGLIGAGAGALVGGDVTGALVGGAVGAAGGYATGEDRHHHR